MNFIYAIILGIIFGLSEIDFFYALLLILLLVFVYALKDIIFKRQFITDIPSAYVLYVNNLEKMGRSIDKAWISYLVKSILVDGIIAIVIYLMVLKFF